MSAKKGAFGKNTLKYLIVIILIVIAFLIILTVSMNDANVEDGTINTITVPQAISPNNQYIGETVKVEGIYHYEDDHFLISTYSNVANPNPTEMLSLDISQLGNDTNLVENQQYVVTGLLSQSQIGIIELEATKIKEK